MSKNEDYLWWRSPVFSVLAGIILLLVVWGLAVEIGNKIKEGQYIGRPTEIRDTITITGEGKVTAIPDIANVTVGMTVEKKTAVEAQRENTQKFNKLVAQFKKLGIKDADITTTDYRINPVYDYTPARGSTIRGYEVAQSVRVKIRDLDKIGDILAAAGESGANQVSGIYFSIDEPEKLRQQARAAALKNAQEKATELASISGVKLGKVVSFSEYGGDTPPRPVPMYMYSEKAMDATQAPSIERGSLDIVVSATVSYEIF